MNRERSALPNNGGTLPPSNGEYFVGRESRGAKGEEDIPEYLGGSVEGEKSFSPPRLQPGQGNRGNGAYYISLICSGDTV